jgi:hypothetical protein
MMMMMAASPQSVIFIRFFMAVYKGALAEPNGQDFGVAESGLSVI